jgi:hypothetical protein
VVVKTRDSPADRPTIAWSRPSTRRPEPTSCDNPSVAAGGQVDRHEVADGRCPVDSVESPEPGTQRLQLGVDVLVAHFYRIDRDLQLAHIGERDLGADVDLGGEDQFLTVFLLGHLDLGLTQRLHV